MPVAPKRTSRFSESGSAVTGGVREGLTEASGFGDGLDKAFVNRNLKPYKTLKPFTKTKGKGKKKKYVGLNKLKGKNVAQLENLSAKAVLKKGKVKSSPLNTKVNTNKYKPKPVRKAKRILNNTPKSHAPGSLSGIKNKRVRRAAQHLRQLRRNRRVNKTPVGSNQAYDIFKGYRR